MKLDLIKYGRTSPPPFAELLMRDLAAQGYSKRGIAARFEVPIGQLNKWLDADPKLNEAFNAGREDERYALHTALYRKAMAGDGPSAMFLLKARHGYREGDQSEQANRVSITFNLPGALKAEEYKVIDGNAAAPAKRLSE